MGQGVKGEICRETDKLGASGICTYFGRVLSVTEFISHSRRRLSPGQPAQPATQPGGPNRSLYIQSLQEQNYSGFMYQYTPRVAHLSLAENNGKPSIAQALLSPQGKATTELHLQDMARSCTQIDGMGPNTGYFSPSGRTLNSAHCLTAVTYENTTNPNTGHEVVAALRNLVNPSAPPLFKEHASDQYWGLYQPPGPLTRTLLKLILPSDRFMPIAQIH